MPVVSIIIPIFNQEKYLRECLESIRSQSFHDFEAIMVDDGSTDNSCLIYEEYAKDDYRFVLCRKTNSGVSSTRNVGIDIARGKYVLFVDADDKLPHDAIENHLKHYSENIDLTTGSMILFSKDNQEVYKIAVSAHETVSTDKCLYNFTPNGNADWQRYMVNRMMRMSIIKENNLRFNEKIAYKEDGLFLVQYLLKCKGEVAYFPDVVYCYRQNPSSAMGALNSGRTEKLVTNIDAHALIIKEMRTEGISDDILGREIRHAFQSRRWVLDKLYPSKYYYKAALQTLAKLFHAVGFTTSAKIAAESINKKTKKLLSHQ